LRYLSIYFIGLSLFLFASGGALEISANFFQKAIRITEWRVGMRSFGPSLVSIFLFAISGCSSSRSGGGGAASSSSNVTADVAVEEDEATQFVQAGESISVVGTNLGPVQQYVVRTKLLMPDGPQISEASYSSMENLRLTVPVSFYTILHVFTPDNTTLSAVVLKPNADSQVNLRFDETSTVAAKILEIIYDKALNGDANAGYLLRNRLLSVSSLYSVAASVLLVSHEQERRKSLNSLGDQSALKPVDLVALANSLILALRSEISSTVADVTALAVKEADASYRYFYTQSLETPTAIAAYATPQAGPVDVAYRASLVNTVVAAAYADLAEAVRTQPPATPVGDITAKATSLFVRTFDQCLQENACPVVALVAAAQFSLVGKVETPRFTVGSVDASSNKFVEISSGTAGAVIHYTLDGTTPSSDSPRFSGPVSVSIGQVLKAVAFKDGYGVSDLAETASFSRSDLDHELVKSKTLKVPDLAKSGDLMILVVMHKFDQTNTSIPSTVNIPVGFTRWQSSKEITGPTIASGEEPMNRYQRISIFFKRFSVNDPKTIEVSYPDNADADQLTAVLISTPSGASSPKDYQEGGLTAMNQPAFFAPNDSPLSLGAGERVVYVASSLFLAEALNDRENTMVFDNVNVQSATNTTAKILGRNSHWRNKLAVVIDSVVDPLISGFYPTRGFDGDNLGNSNLGLRFVIPK
jgi:hypothetical protein